MGGIGNENMHMNSPILFHLRELDCGGDNRVVGMLEHGRGDPWTIRPKETVRVAQYLTRGVWNMIFPSLHPPTQAKQNKVLAQLFIGVKNSEPQDL